MKAYDITILTAEVKSSDNVQFRNKINFINYKLVCRSFSWAWLPEAHRRTYGKSNLFYEDC